jgi:hypothetical protein
MSAQSDAPAPQFRKSFTAESPGLARAAASAWLGDFSAHGPLHLRTIRVVEEGEVFAAIVTYSEARVETTPRFFDNYVPLLKSA